MVEADEEPVVEKTARVKEEVVVRKPAQERTETVRDTARREDVKIERAGETVTDEAAPNRADVTADVPHRP